ncbi:PepSY domain-containing protein [Pseudomonas aeruginosa]|nr:PepSY domain-containing protein [Pseudomonas aeruginosa]
MSEIIKGVEEAGHKTIVELEFEDGVYEIEALDAQGKEVKLKVDPVSGKVNVK